MQNCIEHSFSNDVMSMTWMDTHIIAAGTSDGDIVIMDILTGTIMHEWHAYPFSFNDLCPTRCIGSLVATSRDHLVSFCREKVIKAWDISSSPPTLRWSFGDNYPFIITEITLLHDKIAAFLRNGSICLLDPETGDEFFFYTGHNRTISGMVSITTDMFLSGSWDETFRVWSSTSDEAISVIKVPDSIRSFVYDQGSRTVACVHQDMICMYQLDIQAQTLSPIRTLQTNISQVYKISNLYMFIRNDHYTWTDIVSSQDICFLRLIVNKGYVYCVINNQEATKMISGCRHTIKIVRLYHDLEVRLASLIKYHPMSAQVSKNLFSKCKRFFLA